MNYLATFGRFLRALLLSRAAVAAENLALRQQLAILNRKRPRPKLNNRDRLFWILVARLWSRWQSVLVIATPATVLRWHRHGFQYYCRWKSRSKPGRPTIARELRALIPRLNRENPLWGGTAHPS